MYLELNDWPYEPDKISVRKLALKDHTVIQQRVDCGILQFESVGRPDNGQMFLTHDCEPDYLKYTINLYYKRMICFFVLEEWENVIKDIAVCLQISEIINCDEHESYLLMMQARANAYLALPNYASALAHVNRGLLTAGDDERPILLALRGEIHAKRGSSV